MWRCDWLSHGLQTHFHDTPEAAMAEEAALKLAGVQTVAWFMGGVE